ncbi:FtsK/SpoIIIE domain-containing protein [Campylobacter troglodytis]|uniref:VirB4 family type IV secretion/conjugal transfer ATPase n=1 Tax=Campylobacter troglodytis TaxID=654363 RepID=UPI00163C9107|nr:FtsK/SpoIIIE domain-containing protein [Campylobacter troglodytis]
MCKYDEFLITTKDFNLCMGVKLEGLSYAAVNEEEEIEFAQKRNRFFARLNDDIEMNIIAKKEILEIENDTSSINNFYAKEIIEKWEKKIQVYKTKYYLVFSTKTKSIAGFFEGVKEKTTTEQDKNQQKTNLKTALNLKAKKLYELKTNLLSDLADYKPELINADDLLNIFATYANCQKTNLKYSHKLITDCYLTSDVEFKKDYIIFHRNVTQEKYARFISIKSYETDSITSLISSYLLNENLEFTLFIHCESIAKEKAIKKVKDIKAFTQDAFKMDLEFYIQELKSERENMILVSYSVFLEADSLDELNQISDYIKGLLENQGVVAIKETLNQNPLFFSFFPSRGNLNARMRSLQGKNLATLATFESDNLGFKKNAWGNMPITTFQHLSGAPFLFNLHEHDRVGAAGHTLIIGGTGYGKTTLMQFLMMNLLKYNINIFAMDKAQGMYNFTNYIGGEYHDFNEENTENSFKLNPFSLSNTPENNLFLNTFFCKMGNVDAEKRPEEIELEKLIKITIDQLRRTGVDKEHNDKIATLSEFYSSLHYANEQNTLIHERYEKYLKSFFDNEEDALNFKKQLSILNMDTILKDQKLSSLSALYLFHKVQNISKEQNKGFFIFIDELKDYLRKETMLENILQSILEIRKMGGVMTMGVQNLDFFETVKKNNSFMSSMTNFIIFPTSNSKSLEIMQKELRLTNSEVDFLKNAPKESRQILYKQATINQSAILSVNFARLGNYLRIFSSEREDVNLTKNYKKEYPNEWRERYLNYKKDEK